MKCVYKTGEITQPFPLHDSNTNRFTLLTAKHHHKKKQMKKWYDDGIERRKKEKPKKNFDAGKTKFSTNWPLWTPLISFHAIPYIMCLCSCNLRCIL